MEEARIRGGDAVPAERVDEGAEVPGIVEATLADGLPRFAVENLRIEFQFPDDFERLALGIVVEAGHPDLRACARGTFDSFNEVGPRANPHHVA